MHRGTCPRAKIKGRDGCGCGSSFIRRFLIFTNSFNQKNIFRQIFLFLFGFPSTPAVDQKFVGSFSSFWVFCFYPVV
jgi:hypothetical protein